MVEHLRHELETLRTASHNREQILQNNKESMAAVLVAREEE